MSAFSTILLTLVTTMLINNVVLSQFMGLCPFLGVSKQIKTALGMGAAVIFVITASSAVTAVLYRYVLLRYDLTYLNTIVFIVVIAALVQFVEMILRKFSPALYRALGVYLPLITTNCAVLGVALTNVQKDASVGMSVLNGFGTAAGFALSILLLAGIREKTAHSPVPKAFRGMPITLLTAGLMAIAFFGFKSLA
ncbi:MAG: RnfABCDGE type electron transport complex subunit A [Clostridiales bacterium]|jgi:electron transport complex, rnfABCDGE type, A subunit|nr:RnfABCDGE type electron transport complex subunit A [Clostridiales bacterium]PWM35036.1 MAG: electron transport complex subunit RsxA [Oscillospiraceae bacterium]